MLIKPYRTILKGFPLFITCLTHSAENEYDPVQMTSKGWEDGSLQFEPVFTESQTGGMRWRTAGVGGFGVGCVRRVRGLD